MSSPVPGRDSRIVALPAAEIRRRHPEIVVLMLSGSMDDLGMLAALDAGASGYISKVSGGEEIATDIKRAAAGEMIVSASRRLKAKRASAPADDPRRP